MAPMLIEAQGFGAGRAGPASEAVSCQHHLGGFDDEMPLSQEKILGGRKVSTDALDWDESGRAVRVSHPSCGCNGDLVVLSTTRNGAMTRIALWHFDLRRGRKKRRIRCSVCSLTN